MQSILERSSEQIGLSPNIFLAGVVVLLLLSVGSVVRLIRLRRATAEKRRQRLGSLIVWWVMFLIVLVTALAGTVGGVLTFGTLSIMAVFEYFRMIAKKGVPLSGRTYVYLSVPAVYGCLFLDDVTTNQGFVLFAFALLITIWLTVSGMTTGYVAASTSLVWAMFTFVFLLSHTAKLMTLPPETNPVAGPVGWLLFMIVFTESNDIFQALWGRRIGRHAISPVVSPKKTWEGFLLGGMTAILVGIILSPFLTPFATPWTLRLGSWEIMTAPYLGAVFSGIAMCLAGFFGDLNISAVKRDVGVKDSGDLLPSQGGVLDRIDSLIFTAPTFYYFVQFLYV